MANTNLINDIVLPDSMVHFRNNTILTNAIGAKYNDQYKAFGAKPGQEIGLRTHQLFNIREDSLVMDVSDDRINCSQLCLIEKKCSHQIVDSLPFEQTTPGVGGYNHFQCKPTAMTILSTRRFAISSEQNNFTFTLSCYVA